jgi:uncharacterized RDD family membrane protein YckC
MTGAPDRGHYGDRPVPPGAYAPRPKAERPPPPRPEDLADWWRRAVAVLIDAAIVGTLTIVVLGALGAGLFAGGDLSVGEIVGGLLLATLVFTALILLYAPIVMVSTNGQTLGKLATRCRVVRVDGARVSFGWAVLREVVVKGLVLGIAASLTGGIAYLVDGAWPLVDPQRRALHDYAVDSRVVRA